MIGRLLVVVSLTAGITAGITAATIPASFAEEYKLCLATSQEGSGHEGNYLCVNVPVDSASTGSIIKFRD